MSYLILTTKKETDQLSKFENLNWNSLDEIYQWNKISFYGEFPKLISYGMNSPFLNRFEIAYTEIVKTPDRYLFSNTFNVNLRFEPSSYPNKHPYPPIFGYETMTGLHPLCSSIKKI